MRTGQRAPDTGEVLWEEELPLHNAEDWQRLVATRRGEYEQATLAPTVVRSVWSVHAQRRLKGADIWFLKEPCAVEDTLGKFFLHAYTAGRRPVSGRFGFQRGKNFATMWGDRCLLKFQLPRRVDELHVGGLAADGTILWQGRSNLRQTLLDNVSRAGRAVAAGNGRPLATSGAFEVHRVGDTLVYVREPCADTATRARFFLHIFGTDEVGRERRANMDFDFHARGVMQQDGRCVAEVPLPQWALTRIRTGQYSAFGVHWSAELVAP